MPKKKRKPQTPRTTVSCNSVNRVRSAVISTRLRKLAAQFVQDSLLGHGQRAWGGKAAGAFMAATAEFGRDIGHVDRTFAANADPDPVIGDFAEENSYFHARDAQRVVDQSFTVFFQRAAAIHVLP